VIMPAQTHLEPETAMLALKLMTIGDSVGVALPKEVVAKLKVGDGDTLFLTETPDGYAITTRDPDFERQMALAETIMRDRHGVLRELAK
jgi:putative addiction module antidote